MADEITLDAPETRLERFLAAAAGMDGITLDEPETRIEKYLYKIAQGSGGVPAVEDADKGKFLHANESTGDLEWATPSGGGSMFVITASGTPSTFDKTWKEITDAFKAGSVVVLKTESTDIEGGTAIWYLSGYGAEEYDGATSYYVCFISGNGVNASNAFAEATAENGYPAISN